MRAQGSGAKGKVVHWSVSALAEDLAVAEHPLPISAASLPGLHTPAQHLLVEILPPCCARNIWSSRQNHHSLQS